MAFPGTYDINYYKGDTLEFRIYPKDSNGDTFPLSQYVSPNGTTRFTIATSRGASTGLISGYAQISNDQTYILCAITPANGALMTAGAEYVYDVEIARADAAYDYVYTLLTGSISVTEQITPVGDLAVPNNPTDLTPTGFASDSISISWTAPAEGPEPTLYEVYILPYTIDPLEILAGLQAGPADTVEHPDTFYTLTELSPETDYLVGVLARNDVGPATTETLLSNLGFPLTTLPEGS